MQPEYVSAAGLARGNVLGTLGDSFSGTSVHLLSPEALLFVHLWSESFIELIGWGMETGPTYFSMSIHSFVLVGLGVFGFGLLNKYAA